MGLRGPHAVGLLSRWQAPAQPLPKRVCPRCERLFKPKRRDAKFCSQRCRQAIYWRRHLADRKVDDRPTFVLVLRPESPGIDVMQALKALKKFIGRKYGLRVVTMNEQQDAA